MAWKPAVFIAGPDTLGAENALVRSSGHSTGSHPRVGNVFAGKLLRLYLVGGGVFPEPALGVSAQPPPCTALRPGESVPPVNRACTLYSSKGCAGRASPLPCATCSWTVFSTCLKSSGPRSRRGRYRRRRLLRRPMGRVMVRESAARWPLPIAPSMAIFGPVCWSPLFTNTPGRGCRSRGRPSSSRPSCTSSEGHSRGSRWPGPRRR